MSTVEVTRRGPRPAIRLRPVPRHDPPFDDERQPEVWASPQQIALDWSSSPPAAVAAARAARPEERPVTRTVVAGASGDAKLAVRRFVGLCIEVLNGYRPAAHLRRLCQPREAAAVVSQGLSGARRVAETRRHAAGARTTRPRRPTPVAVVQLRLCEPRAGAVEAAVVLVIGERTWAMALRLELHQGSWVATTLRLI